MILFEVLTGDDALRIAQAYMAVGIQAPTYEWLQYWVALPEGYRVTALIRKTRSEDGFNPGDLIVKEVRVDPWTDDTLDLIIDPETGFHVIDRRKLQ